MPRKTKGKITAKVNKKIEGTRKRLKIDGKKVGLGLAIFLVVMLVAGVVYAKFSGKGAAVIVGGFRAGVWFDPETGMPSIQTGAYGCCRPMCSDAFELECEQLAEGMEGTRFEPQACSQIEECGKGCCQIDCMVRDLPKEACEYVGGNWAETCELGCCKTEYHESEIPELTCTTCVEGSDWYPGECLPGYSVVVSGGSGGAVDFSDDWGGESMGKGLNALLDMAGGDRSISRSVEYRLYTCGDTPYGKWKGTRKSIMYTGEGGEPKVRESETELTFTEEGFKYGASIFPEGIATVEVSGRIEGNQMYLDMKMPLVPDIQAQGTIKMGADECRRR